MIHPIPDAYTVVIFSSPIKDWFKRLGTGVLHISWPLVKKYHNENGTRLASTIFNCLTIQLQIRKYLRIVCIDALDSNGELSWETAKDVLHYLAQSIQNAKSIKKTNSIEKGKSIGYAELVENIELSELKKKKSVIDAIILPNFNPKVADPDEIMQLLWYLRKHAVLISDSSLHSSLPSTETIAVSGATKIHHTPASVVDFIVTVKKARPLPSVTSASGNQDEDKQDLFREWLNIELARAKSPGVVAAVALGILKCLRIHFPDIVAGNIYELFKQTNYFDTNIFYLCLY